MEQESKFNYSQYSEKIAELERDLEAVDSELAVLKSDIFVINKRTKRGMPKEQKDAIIAQMLVAQRQWRELMEKRHVLLSNLKDYQREHGMDLYVLAKRKPDNEFIN